MSATPVAKPPAVTDAMSKLTLESKTQPLTSPQISKNEFKTGKIKLIDTKPTLGMSDKIKKLKVEDLEIKITLGTGSFGRVHLVKYKATGKHYAMKVLKKAEVIKLRQVEHTMNEKTILEKLDHPFLVQILGTFQDPNNLYLVLEYIQGGELFTYLRKSGVIFIDFRDFQTMLRDFMQPK
jgi:serine/threonine protein kinase